MFYQFIVLFTNRLDVRDLDVLVPPKFMFFWCASLQTGPQKHIYAIFLKVLCRSTVGMGLRLGTGWRGDELGMWLGMGLRTGLRTGLGLGLYV